MHVSTLRRADAVEWQRARVVRVRLKYIKMFLIAYRARQPLPASQRRARDRGPLVKSSAATLGLSGMKQQAVLQAVREKFACR